MKTEGLRFNTGKTRHDLVPDFAQEQYARVLTKGAEKYAERNWEKGMAWSKVISSLERHLRKLKMGEDYDEETGLLHSAHIMCNAAFITEYYRIYPQGDDRPMKPEHKIGLDIDEVICDWLGGWTERYKLPVPRSWYFHRGILDEFDKMKADGTINDFYLNLKPKISPDEIPFEPHCYITSRPVDVSVTIEWLDKHGFPTRPVYCVGSGQSKVKVAKDAGIDIFVDDRYENFTELNAAGIFTYLMDAPHNQRYHVGHRRIYSLHEICSIREMSK